MLKIIIIILAAMLTVNSIALLRKSHPNFGTIFVYLLTVTAIGCAVFFDRLTVFFSADIGFVYLLILLVGIVLYILSLFLVFVLPFKTMNGNEKAIIVLGAGLNGTEVSRTLKFRLDSALEFYRQHEGIKICVTGSKGRYEIIPEAVAMQKYLIDNDVPKEDIFVDPLSPTTYDNIKNALELFNQHGVDISHGILISTNHFHCYRSCAYAKMQGISNPTFAPSPLPLTVLLSSYTREFAAIVRLWVIKK